MTTCNHDPDCDGCPESEKYCHGYCEDCLLFDACAIEYKYRLHPVGSGPEQGAE